MSSYKLTYFTGLGQAELVRLIFAQAGVKYEDVRITPERWPEIKPSKRLLANYCASIRVRMDGSIINSVHGSGLILNELQYVNK